MDLLYELTLMLIGIAQYIVDVAIKLMPIFVVFTLGQAAFNAYRIKAGRK